MHRSRKRGARLVRERGLPAGCPRRRKPRTTDSQHAQPVAPNLLARDFTAGAPNRTWVADLTAVPTRTGWPSPAGILDGYSRRAIGWAMDGSRDERLVETALDMALTARQPAAGLLRHSDRGSQYTGSG
jgi:putative transposase